MKPHGMKQQPRALVAMLSLFCLLMAPSAALSKGLQPLNKVPVPLPNLDGIVVNKAAAIQLGKALFWDVQAGSDGVTACASCHYQAGADIRVINTINPGANGIFDTAQPGATLFPSMFPINSGDVVGSAGVVSSLFLGLSGNAVDNFVLAPDPLFHDLRQVTGRNAPSVINAVYYYRGFWDGRANNVFNGVNPAGPNNPEALIYKVDANGKLNWGTIALPNASLASQATGPILNAVEMSAAGRTFPLVGKKLLGLTPLGAQLVANTDSVLGTISASPSNGLNKSYADLIKAAFHPSYWDSTELVNGFNLTEQNFSLFWGLSIMLYEATLISDQTPVDKYLAGNQSALTKRQVEGLKIFNGKGQCAACHGGAELSEATVSQAGNNPLTGFANTAVRPVAEDGGDVLQPNKGLFKAVALRNVELNGPYFHNGNQATLRQVVEFYDRGGDFRSALTDGDVKKLNLSTADKEALVDFMVGLTDARVRYERAPFDHPSLTVPDGPVLPAVGAGGRVTPLATFMGLSPFQQ